MAANEETTLRVVMEYYKSPNEHDCRDYHCEEMKNFTLILEVIDRRVE